MSRLDIVQLVMIEKSIISTIILLHTLVLKHNSIIFHFENTLYDIANFKVKPNCYKVVSQKKTTINSYFSSFSFVSAKSNSTFNMVNVEDTASQLQTLDGRKYHANSKIAYLMPEDADGMSSQIHLRANNRN